MFKTEFNRVNAKIFQLEEDIETLHILLSNLRLLLDSKTELSVKTVNRSTDEENYTNITNIELLKILLEYLDIEIIGEEGKVFEVKEK